METQIASFYIDNQNKILNFLMIFRWSTYSVKFILMRTRSRDTQWGVTHAWRSSCSCQTLSVNIYLLMKYNFTQCKD